MTTPYDIDLDRNPANLLLIVALLSFVNRGEGSCRD
jgi:hypothetical protein